MNKKPFHQLGLVLKRCKQFHMAVEAFEQFAPLDIVLLESHHGQRVAFLQPDRVTHLLHFHHCTVCLDCELTERLLKILKFLVQAIEVIRCLFVMFLSVNESSVKLLLLSLSHILLLFLAQTYCARSTHFGSKGDDVHLYCFPFIPEVRQYLLLFLSRMVKCGHACLQQGLLSDFGSIGATLDLNHQCFCVEWSLQGVANARELFEMSAHVD